MTLRPSLCLCVLLFAMTSALSGLFSATSLTSTRRNVMLTTHRKDPLIDWMLDMLSHSFVLDAKETYVGTMSYIEGLISEHSANPSRSRLRDFVPSVGAFHTQLPLASAFRIYDNKYAITKRRHIPPSFNEVRHILNLAQIMAIGEDLDMITFDGDQTLYSNGGNFDPLNHELALSIVQLLSNNVKVAVITAAGYGLDGSKYEVRLRGLLQRFVNERLTPEQVDNFYVFGGECNYLLHAKLSAGSDGSPKVKLLPVAIEDWQDSASSAPKPHSWPAADVKALLDIAEQSMKESIEEMRLRARILRKERAIGVYPGGPEMAKVYPDGHGSNKLKQEALDELVLRVLDSIREHGSGITLPFCMFNGGTDAWLDIGNKSVAVAALQAFLKVPHSHCLHVGDQFLNVGNDIPARQSTACIWIVNPHETSKVLQHVLRYKKIPLRLPPSSDGIDSASVSMKVGASSKMSIYTGEFVP